MKKILYRTISIMVLIMALLLGLERYAFSLVNPSSQINKTTLASRNDMRRFFEKAMALFEAGRYKEAISVFENLIEIEKAQDESYFTPFAEIYIDKSKSRMEELFILEEKRWERMKQDVIREAEDIVKQEPLELTPEKKTVASNEIMEEDVKAKQEISEIAKQELQEEEALLEEKERLRALAIKKAEEIAKQEKERQRLEEARQKLEKERLKQKKERQRLEVERQKLEEEKKARHKIEQAKKRETHELARKVKDAYEKAMRYYKDRDYPKAIVGFKKVKELDPESKLISKAESFIEKAQRQIKKQEERDLLVRMETARRAKIQMELEKRRKKIEEERREREKQRVKRIFEERLRARMVRERLARIEELMDKIKTCMSQQRFEKAEKVLNEAIGEFPENKQFNNILHYVKKQKIRMEEDALKKAREIIEEKMLLEVAEKHLIPDVEIGVLEKKKTQITPLVKIPEIRKRLEIPISLDFKDVELDYVLTFLSDATGVNIVPSSEIDMSEKKVTIKIRAMPLEEALRYILKSQDLVYRIEEDAVWVATKEELDNENIETRVYFLNQGIGRFAEVSATFGESGEGSSSDEVKTVKDILEEAVDWPKDSKLTLDDRTGALIISNIPSNFEIIENLLYNLDVTPKQVLIEARFLEVQVTDVDELGFEWKLNSAWGLTQNNAKQNKHGFASNSGVDFSNFTRSDEGFNLTYQGILSHPQFQVVLHALKEKQDVKTLSAPRITTLNNQTATIEVIDEFIYPTRYEVSLVQYDINGDGDFDDAGETEWANIPQDFVTRDVGILLHVKPSVGIDDKTITLALTPEVSESSASYTYSGDVSIPQFQTRNLSTSIIIGSGETVVLGGLIKDTNTNIKTKVPLLGDLPLVGGLFRKNTENVVRRNLLIFVTATLLDKEEEVVATAPIEEEFRREQ